MHEIHFRKTKRLFPTTKKLTTSQSQTTAVYKIIARLRLESYEAHK
jgi:hypothetical protein